MNEGAIAICLIALTIAAAVVLVLYRDLIFGLPVGARPGAAPRPVRPPQRVKPQVKPDETVSTNVSSIVEPYSDGEMIAFRAIAKLIIANQVTQTDALFYAFEVRPGKSARYTAARNKLQIALDEVKAGQSTT